MRKQSQLDPRWKNIKLGTSNVNLGGYGCVITSYANLADTTPPVVNKYLIAHGGFSQGNLVKWSYLPGFIGRAPYDNNAVKEAIKKYGACMVQVDYDGNPSTIGDHYILYIGNHRAIDPLGGKVVKTSRYSDVKRYIMFDVEKAKLAFSKSTMEVDTKIYSHLVNGATVRKEVAEYLNISDPDNASKDDILRVIGGYKSRNTDLQNQLFQCQAERENRKSQVSRLKDQLAEELKLRKDLLNKLNKTLEEQGGSFKVYEDRIKVLQGQVDECSKAKGELNKEVAKLKAGSGEIQVGNLLVRIWNKIKKYKI